MNMKKNVMWNTIGSVFYSFCQWAMTVVIVYLTSDYGIIGTLGLAMTVTNTFTTISSFGMRDYQISDIKGQYRHEEYIMSRRITAAVAFIGCVIYSMTIDCTRIEMTCIIMYMMLRLVESGEDVYQGILQLNNRYDIIGISYFLRGITQILSFILVFYFTNNLIYAFLTMVISNLAIFLAFDIRKVKKIVNLGKIVWDKKILSLYGICVFLVFFNFATSSLATLVRVSMRETLGQENLGIYSTIASPTVIVQLLAIVVFSPFIPVLAKNYLEGNKKKMKSILGKVSIVLFLFFIIINIGGYFFGNWGLTLLYNKDIAFYSELLIPLLWCTFFLAVLWLLAGTLIAMRKIKILVIGSLIELIMILILRNPMILTYGMNGASYAQAIAEFSCALLFAVTVFIEIMRMDVQEKDNKDSSKNQLI